MMTVALKSSLLVRNILISLFVYFSPYFSIRMASIKSTLSYMKGDKYEESDYLRSNDNESIQQKRYIVTRSNQIFFALHA